MLAEKSFYFLFLLLLLLSLLLVILLLPLKIRISINNLRKTNTVFFELNLFFWRRFKLFSYQRHLLSLKEEEEGLLPLLLSFMKKKQGRIEPRERGIKKHLLIIYRLITAFGWERMDLHVKLGTGDPSWTGIITGFLSFLSDMLSLYISKTTGSRRRPGIFVYPSFFQKELVFTFNAEFRFNGLRVIYYSIRLFLELAVAVYLKKIWGCIKNGGTSYSGFNDYGDGKLKGDG
ncbi:MAG: DUF2953 domain-containing protein [Firmicutes bacterium]|nr:DUF2953 domain-containing protein [Bacillota bacterium]